MATRKDLVEAVRDRYRKASQSQKSAILDEFVALTGYHRKHAIRVMGFEQTMPPAARKPRNRLYEEAVRQVLVVLWEASDRVCSKRLKALIPSLVDAMERHGHLDLDPEVKAKLLCVSASTIDRALGHVRAEIDGARRRRPGVGTTIRRSVPVRTFADWGDPPPGFLEVDMVEHCGGAKTDGNFVHTLVLTDIATGWTECVAMPVRDQSLIVAAMTVVARKLPFPMRGIDTDNDSAFMNDTVFEHCKRLRIEQTRSRAYKKNDQAWVEQKNGAIVRRLVGYGKLSGVQATEAVAGLYESARLYVNFFQPSFKLKSKTRDGARVTKAYHPPATPCDRLLASDRVDEAVKSRLRQELAALDPVRLLRDIRAAQSLISGYAATGAPVAGTEASTDLAAFLNGLATAWESGEVRPTHRKEAREPRWWRTRPDPFADAWPQIERWLRSEPTATAKELLERLVAIVPDVYAGRTQLRTLQRRIQTWRAERAKDLILGRLKLQLSTTTED